MRGPQSTLYGPRALAGVIQLFTKQGSGAPAATSASEGGSYDTFRETLAERRRVRNNSITRLASADLIPTMSGQTTNIGSPTASRTSAGRLTISCGSVALFTYSFSRHRQSQHHLRSETFRQFSDRTLAIAPHLDCKPVDWWEHKLIFSYDHERQVNDPNRGWFRRADARVVRTLTLDYQNDLEPASWLTLTTGFFYSHVDAGQERPFVSQAFGPQPTFISDHTEETAGFLQASVTPLPGSESGRRRALRSLQSIRRRLDLSVCRQLLSRRPTRIARECRHRFQSAEQPGQNFRQQLRIWSRKKILAGMLASNSGFWDRRVTIGALIFTTTSRT